MNDIIQQIQQEYRIADDGSVTVSIRGVARLAGVSWQALSKQFSTGSSGGNISSSKLVQSLESRGFEAATFSVTGVPDTAVALILEYYAFDAGKRCTDRAKNCCRAFMAIGIRTWIQQQAGWSQPQKSQPKALPYEFTSEVWQQLQPHERHYHSETDEQRQERRHWDIRDIRHWFRRHRGF
ncbi:hypothetical protein IQ235_00950 [Oscillatoriales cyanobacterium LEGE 11467]|uniref:Uncharacterized protein n=1 Tax=Zarconia navalis LEGE 11467 TaxID=1828826 RepID=A0A928VU48_9CYAN|nr:hypothetical protein [Zarconia navalis]MBE9039363.1 hypothetical protein [Zarconia navalis LEGE 11467]